MDKSLRTVIFITPPKVSLLIFQPSLQHVFPEPLYNMVFLLMSWTMYETPLFVYSNVWAFKPCIEGFNYCKPIVQVDDTFLTGKYHGTLLVAIAQDENRNIFPLAFAIVEGETKEALTWFFQLLRQYVT